MKVYLPELRAMLSAGETPVAAAMCHEAFGAERVERSPDDLERMFRLLPRPLRERLTAAAQAEPVQRKPWERMVDVLTGTDSLIAAQMVGEQGHVTGIDMTQEMLAKAGAAAAEMGTTNVEFVEGEAERLPFPDASFDVVISNGVIDLIPDKDAVFAELFRVLAPGGRIQVADVTIQNPVSAEGRRNIDLWTG